MTLVEQNKGDSSMHPEAMDPTDPIRLIDRVWSIQAALGEKTGAIVEQPYYGGTTNQIGVSRTVVHPLDEHTHLHVNSCHSVPGSPDVFRSVSMQLFTGVGTDAGRSAGWIMAQDGGHPSIQAHVPPADPNAEYRQPRPNTAEAVEAYQNFAGIIAEYVEQL